MVERINSDLEVRQRIPKRIEEDFDGLFLPKSVTGIRLRGPSNKILSLVSALDRKRVTRRSQRSEEVAKVAKAFLEIGWNWKSIGPDNFHISFVTSSDLRDLRVTLLRSHALTRDSLPENH